MTQGSVAIDFAAGAAGSHVVHLYQSDPLRVMFPRVPASEPLQAALITTSGGMVGGDTHSVRISAGAGSNAMVIGQAAEFDYAGAQALRSLKTEGVRVVLLNSNPATVMTAMVVITAATRASTSVNPAADLIAAPPYPTSGSRWSRGLPTRRRGSG